MLRNYFLITLFCFQFFGSMAQSHVSPRLVLAASSGEESYAPFRYGDKVYFSTIYKKNKKSVPASRLLSIESNREGLNVLDVNPKKDNLHASNLTMTSDGQWMFYSICQDETQDRCAIWKRKKTYEGGWGVAKKLPAHINLRKYTATQPSIGYDQTIKKKVLYFVSDRPGGKGGKDIWQSIIELDGTYGEPTALSINTALDEITPFFQLSEQVLFFSSNGWDGSGGFDVFSTKKTNKDEWEMASNLGIVINTSFDETYFTYNTAQKKIYFTSTRPASESVSANQANIYETEAGVEVRIPVYNAHNMQPLFGTKAQIYDEISGQKIVVHERPFESNLTVSLLPGRVYKIVVLKGGFMPSVIEMSTEGIVFPVSYQQEVQLFKDEIFAEGDRESILDKQSSLKDEKNNSIKVNSKGSNKSIGLE